MVVKKVSAAAMRRATREVRHRSSQPLTAAQQEVLKGYVPQRLDLSSWTRVAAPTKELLAQAGGHLSGVESLRQHCTHLAHYAVWLDQAHHQVTFDSLTNLAMIDEYTRLEQARRTAHSASDRRAKLRRLAAAVNPAVTLPERGHTIARAVTKPGYTTAEVAAITRVAQVQPTAEKTRSMCALVGLGLGAGCDSTDLKHIYTRDITEDEHGMSVTVRSRGRERTVPIMTAYTPLVRNGLQGRYPAQLLVGEKEHRRNVAARIINQAAIHGDVPKIEAGRLRSTWLTVLLTRPIPLPVLLYVAGLDTARTLLDLLPALGAGDSEVAR